MAARDREDAASEPDARRPPPVGGNEHTDGDINDIMLAEIDESGSHNKGIDPGKRFPAATEVARREDEQEGDRHVDRWHRGDRVGLPDDAVAGLIQPTPEGMADRLHD